MTATALLEAQALDVERGGRRLFSDLSLRVMPGDIVHLRGSNGAGKTTLLRILAGLTRYGFAGSVTRHAPALFLGHHSAVKALLTPRENLAWHPSGEIFGDPREVDAALDAVGLYGFEDVPAGNLSAGQQRRVNLARLYLSSQPLWLLDEPFTAIDAPGVLRLSQRIALHAQQGGAVLLTSHQPLELETEITLIDLSGTGEP